MGVSKFAGLSIFSALNNLEDITFDEKYNSMLWLYPKGLDGDCGIET
jgi:hypothetical protein